MGEHALLVKLSNDVEKYEIKVTKMGQNYSFFLTVWRCRRQRHRGAGADYSARSTEKNFSPSFLSYQDGLSWHLRASKTRLCRFHTMYSSLSTVAGWLPTGLPGAPPNSRILPEMWLLSRKVSVATALCSFILHCTVYNDSYNITQYRYTVYIGTHMHNEVINDIQKPHRHSFWVHA